MKHPTSVQDIARESRLTAGAVALFAALAMPLAWSLCSLLAERLRAGEWLAAAGQGLFMAITALLLYGGLVYLLARRGYLERLRDHQARPEPSLDAHSAGPAPAVAVLIPAYNEDPAVVHRTLLCAALLDYPEKRVVLLIDNPPHATDARDQAVLAETRRLPGRVAGSLAAPAARLRAAGDDFAGRADEGTLSAREELHRLAGHYEEAARALDRLRAGFPVRSHEDAYFSDHVLAGLAGSHRQRAQKLRSRAQDGVETVRRGTLEAEYRRLAGLFGAEITGFERKRYANLSHESNKAMNVNAYLDLMGRRLAEETRPDGLYLVPSVAGAAIPDAEFVITLDADSILAPEYAARLVAIMTRPGNERLAVVQTPYSAFPGARRPIERIAGATTDIQYLIHQGFTRHNATFWVGANALLRKRALEDIATTAVERGHPIRRFIQDRTVIEDTESSVDLVARGWRLYNHPQRLAHSATPPDFGSLLIQRRRWANGGLIIMPKLLRYLVRQEAVPNRLGHALMGLHYLSTLATVNLGLLLLLLVPFEGALRNPWLPAATLPYFVLYARDLARLGYRLSDLFRVYALNLLLVPVNLGGVVKSVQQVVTGRRTPFGRTPKVPDRTTTPALYLLLVYAFLAYCGLALYLDLLAGRWMHGVFLAFNGTLLGYAVIRFVGLRESCLDLALALRRLRPERRAAASARLASDQATG